MANYKELVEQISSYLDGKKDEMVQFLQEFVSIKSVTYEEKEAVEFLANKMKEFGYDEVRIDDVGNVLGRVGSGPKVILYDSHIDTVELGDETAWKHDPLGGEIEDGKIYGRGTTDDKGPLAAITWAGRALKELGLVKDFTMWVSGSLSEEDVEGSAVEEMMKVNSDIKPDFVVVGEASEMQVIRGHKGRALIKITVPGKAAHASVAHTGDNALIKALPIIEGIDQMNDLGEDEFLGKGTIEVTKVDCKTPSLNTIPGEAVVYADRRITCSETREELIAELQPLLDKVPGATAVIDTEHYDTWKGYHVEAEDYFPSWIMPEDHPVIKAGLEAYELTFGKETKPGIWPFCTNATALCGRQGIPSVGFGPSLEDLCHVCEEYIPIDEYVDAAKFYAMIALTASGK